jgi:hypothetical protein
LESQWFFCERAAIPPDREFIAAHWKQKDYAADDKKQTSLPAFATLNAAKRHFPTG